jgi:hypothetical protein
MADETWFAEMKRYVRFGADDEVALRRLFWFAAPAFPRIAEEFYQRLEEHPRAKAVFSGSEQVQRLKATLCDWLRLLLVGPWDESYYTQRARIGHMHVKIGLPQKYMFGAMNLIRIDLIRIAQRAHTEGDPSPSASQPSRIDLLDVTVALQKVIDRSGGATNRRARSRQARSAVRQSVRGSACRAAARQRAACSLAIAAGTFRDARRAVAERPPAARKATQHATDQQPRAPRAPCQNAEYHGFTLSGRAYTSRTAGDRKRRRRRPEHIAGSKGCRRAR